MSRKSLKSTKTKKDASYCGICKLSATDWLVHITMCMYWMVPNQV